MQIITIFHHLIRAFQLSKGSLSMDSIFLFIAGLAALSGLLAVMIYLLAVSREMQLPDVDEV
jgi:hypothetical protein